MESNDHWTMGEFALCRKKIKENPMKKRSDRFGEYNKYIYILQYTDFNYFKFSTNYYFNR